MRNKPEDVARLIDLPQGAAAVFGLCIGYAADGKGGAIKPRLPQEAVLHHGRYELEKQDAAIERYNHAMAAFNERERVNTTTPWTIHSARRVAGPESLSGRHVLMQALRRMGFFKAE